MTGRILVIGGGIGGATAARELARAGANVTLAERGDRLGGLVASFAIAGTPLEMFYHHVFPPERDIVGLIGELGLADRLQWFPSSVGIFRDGRMWPFTSPADLLRFGPLPPVQRIRTGLGALRLAAWRGDWRALDGVTARDWLASLTGAAAASVVWEPMLRARFGPAATRVPAAWMWGRFRQRAGARRRGREWLGYLRGGFAQVFRGLEEHIRAAGVEVRLQARVERIAVDGEAVVGATVDGEDLEFDSVLFTGPLPALPGLVPEAARDPRWSAIGGLGAICVVLELSRPLGDLYWTNVCDPDVPFGGIIEHTNLVPAEDYGGRRIVYLSRYFTAEERFASVDLDEEAARWIDVLAERLPGFDRGDVAAVHPFRTPYAAPLPELGHAARIPPARSHLRGLYLATTAQIYPHDRGMNEGMRQALGVARSMRGAAVAGRVT